MASNQPMAPQPPSAHQVTAPRSRGPGRSPEPAAALADPADPTDPAADSPPGSPVDAPAPHANTRIAALDGLRFLAALAVVVFHFTAQAGHYQRVPYWDRPVDTAFPSLFPITSYFWTGVELFFMISGFVICMSAWGKRVGDFAISRIVRLYPAYWFAVLLTAAFLYFVRDVHQPLNYRELFMNLTMLQRPFGFREAQGTFWTLWPELKFYLLFAIVVWRGLTYRRTVAFCALWLIARILAFASGNGVLHEIFNAQFSHFFVAGIVLYLIYRHGPNPVLWSLLAVTYLIAVASSPGDFNWNAEFNQPDWPVAVLYTLFFVVLTLIALRKADRIRWRGWTVLGTISYPLYLIHETIGGSIIVRLHRQLPDYLLLLLVIGGLVLAAWLIHICVERPVTDPLRRALRRGLAEIRAMDTRDSGGKAVTAGRTDPDGREPPNPA